MRDQLPPDRWLARRDASGGRGRGRLAAACRLALLALLLSLTNQVGAQTPTATDAGPAFRIVTSGAGLVRIRYEDLTAAGLPTGTIDPRTIHVANRGAEIAIRVLGEEDGRFDNSDVVLFYAQAYADRFTNQNVYWLSAGGARGKRMPSRDVTPGAAPYLPSFRATVHAEQDTAYWQAMPGATEDDRWFWGSRLGPPGQGVATGRDYPVTLGAVAPSGPAAQLRMRLKGYTALGHRVRLDLNGSSVGERAWQGQGVFDQVVDVPQSLLLTGMNTVRVEALDAGAVVDQFLVNWIEVTHSALYLASGDSLVFSAATTGRQLFILGGFSSPAIDVYDITNAADPVRLTAGQAEAGNRLRFEDAPSLGAVYAAITPNAWRAPISITADAPSRLASPENAADYIVISPREFWGSAEALAAHRRSQGYRTAVVDMEDVYDEFSTGLFTPVAIRDFLRYAYRNWQRPAPAYVVLLGDAYQDYKDNLHTGTRNFVPSYSFGSSLFGEVSSDNWLAAVDGGDVLPDLHLGRLAAQSPEEAATMVAKVIGYDQRAKQAGGGQLLLVADDDEPEFAQLSDSLAVLAASRKIYAASYPPGNPTDDILAAIDAGVGFVNYAGHGEHNAWGRWDGNSQSLFTLPDVARLRNADRLPVVTVGDCLNGFFTGPGNNPSLAEAFQRQPNGGAIAVWAPTGYGYPLGHRLLLEGFYRAIFGQGIAQLGPATTAAKAAAYADSPFWGELINTYVLFGDPATRVSPGAARRYLPAVLR